MHSSQKWVISVRVYLFDQVRGQAIKIEVRRQTS